MRSLKTLFNLQLAAVLAAALVLLATALVGARQLGDDAQKAFVAKDVTADILPPPMYLIEMRLVLSQALEGTLAPRDAAAEVERLEREYAARAAYWRANPPFGLERDLLGAQHEAALNFIEAVKKEAMAPLLAGQPEAARAALPKLHALYAQHRAGVDATVRSSSAFAEAAVSGFERVRGLTTALALAVFAATALLLTGFSLWLRRTVWRSVGAEPTELAAAAELAAQGDLSRAIPAAHAGSVAASLERMRTSLAGTVSEVRLGAQTVSAASAQIAAGNLDLSGRTEEQASSLEQTAASLEQLTATVRQSADNAGQANAAARAAAQAAAQGGDVVGQVVGTMREISEASRRIGEITAVIDGIAFQTNILALNAAVEAARASEHGRGFAVVAGEVRTLAQRSAEAAREIKSVIGDSIAKVGSGSQLAEQAGASMAGIVAQVHRVSELIEAISRAAGEQSGGLGQVNEVLAQMDQVTQQNAALVEEGAAAAQSLNDQARRLEGAVAVFRLDAQPAA